MKYLKQVFLFLRILPFSLFFCLKYLPFRKAIKIPILLYRPRFITLKGKITVENPSFGMVRLGFHTVPIYPNAGFVWDNKGGEVVFKGCCNIGNASAISVEKNARLIFGDHFEATTQFKCVCHYFITFSYQVCFGWNCIVVDTDFHKLSSLKGVVKRGYAPVFVGCYNWFAMNCVLLKGTITADHCVVGANTILTGKYDLPYSLIIGNPAKIKATGMYRDFSLQKIIFEKD